VLDEAQVGRVLMRVPRIAGVVVAAAVVSGAGLLLSSPTGAVTPTAPITLDSTGMASTSCPPLPVGLYSSIALKPATTVQFQPGFTLALGQRMTLSVLSEAHTTPAPTAKSYVVPASGVKVAFPSTGTYALDWKTNGVLGVAGFEQHGKLVIDSTAAGCKLGVQVPVASLSASAVPSPITSAINGGLGGVASTANSLLSPVNSALPTIPAVPTGLPTVPPLPGVPLPGANPPGSTPAPGANAPGTIYKPHGPTVADRTVPDGYGSGSGLGGAYVPVTGNSNSINAAAGQQQASNGKPGGAATSATPAVKSGGSPKSVELASNRPRSALGALPTLAVVLAILALSGATTFYARTFLLQPAEARVKVTP
jgi:hypothetical protein